MEQRGLDVGARVVVRSTTRTREKGTAGWHGSIGGKSYENDEPGAKAVVYAVAMDEDDGSVWMVGVDEVELDAR